MYVGQADVASRSAKLRAQLFGSGTILIEALKAQEMLEEKYDVGADVWSVTSYDESVSRRARVRALEPAASRRQAARAVRHAGDGEGARACSSPRRDYLKVLPDSIDRWLPRRLQSLGTDGFGRSERRARRCATSSKWMPASSRWRRCTRCMQEKQIDAGRRAAGDQGSGHQSREARSGDFIMHRRRERLLRGAS